MVVAFPSRAHGCPAAALLNRQYRHPFFQDVQGACQIAGAGDALRFIIIGQKDICVGQGFLEVFAPQVIRIPIGVNRGA